MSFGDNKTPKNNTSVYTEDIGEVNLLNMIRSNVLSKNRKLETKNIINNTRKEIKDANDKNLDSVDIEKIYHEYSDDLNLNKINELVLAKFNNNKELKKLEEDKIKEERNLREILNIVEYQYVMENIRLITEKINKNKNNDKEKYIEESKYFLDIYNSIGTIKNIVVFKKEDNNQAVRIESNDKNKLRHFIISRYLDIVKKYFNLNIIREIKSIDNCEVCSADKSKIITNDTGLCFCIECNTEKIIFTRTPFFKEQNGLMVTNKNNYEDKENFNKALLRFQGKQNPPPEHIFSDLDKYFISYQLPSSENIKKLPVDKKGRKEKTSKELMYKALKETKNEKYYRDINLICHIYWGWSLSDVSNLEEIIMQDYERTQQIYDQVKKGRKSGLNTDFRLYKHLEARGFQCDPYDYKMVDTREILEYYEKTWKEMASKAGLNYKPTI